MKPKRWVAFGCAHGEHVDRAAFDQMLTFVSNFKPQVRICLGDVWDTTAMRGGATGTADEGADVEADWMAGVRILEEYRPSVFFHGNHEARIARLLDHGNALVRYAAEQVSKSLSRLCRELRCEVVPYDIEAGWRQLGNCYFGHGYMFNQSAIRDHAEMLGGNVVIAHLHRQGMEVGRGLGAPVGYCVGCMADIPAMSYARARRQTTSWQVGFAFGEYTEETCSVNLKLLRDRKEAARVPQLAIR